MACGSGRVARYLFSRNVPDEERFTKVSELNDYVYGLVDFPADDPDLDSEADIISRLVHDQLRTGRLDRCSVQGIAFILLVAGHEMSGKWPRSVRSPCSGTPSSTGHSGRIPLLPRSPSRDSRTTCSLSEPNWRVAKEDTVIVDHEIRAGEAVVPITFSANRDEAQYDEPDALDIYVSDRTQDDNDGEKAQ